MFRRSRIHVPALPGAAAVAALAATLFVAGCGDDTTAPPPKPQVCAPTDSVVTDFALADVNPNSATHDQQVSPRQHLGQISAWYFGHST